MLRSLRKISCLEITIELVLLSSEGCIPGRRTVSLWHWPGQGRAASSRIFTRMNQGKEVGHEGNGSWFLGEAFPIC